MGVYSSEAERIFKELTNLAKDPKLVKPVFEDPVYRSKALDILEESLVAMHNAGCDESEKKGREDGLADGYKECAEKIAGNVYCAFDEFEKRLRTVIEKTLKE